MFILEERVPKQILNAACELSISVAYVACVAAPVLKDLPGKGPQYALLIIGIVTILIALSIKAPAPLVDPTLLDENYEHDDEDKAGEPSMIASFMQQVGAGQSFYNTHASFSRY